MSNVRLLSLNRGITKQVNSETFFFYVKDTLAWPLKNSQP